MHATARTSSFPSASPRAGLAAPLVTAPDMHPRWVDSTLDFDQAAEALVEAHRADGAATDLPIADLTTWALAPAGRHFSLAPLTQHRAPLVLRQQAFSQLLARLPAPVEFLRRLPAPLQLATLNYLMLESDDVRNVCLRLRGGEVSAVVSERYAPLDAADLVTTVRASLTRLGLTRNVEVRAVATGVVDNLRLILPSEAEPVKPGDVSALGIDITTSSFGRSAVHITPVVWRLVCTNGLKRPERRSTHSFRHLGDRQRLRNGVFEAIPAALAHARGLLQQWKRSVSFMVEDVEQQVQALRDLTLGERAHLEASILHASHEAALPKRLPLYDFVNALTDSAKQAPPARRLEVEAIAGDLLERHVGGA